MDRRNLHWVPLTFAVALGLIVAVGLLCWFSLARFIEAAEWRNHTYQVLAAIEELRDELPAPPPSGLSAERVLKKLNQLRQLTTDNPHQQQRFARLEELAARQGDLRDVQEPATQLLNEAVQEEQLLLEERDRLVRDSARRAQAITVLTTTTAFGLMALAGLALRREFAARLRAETALQETNERLRAHVEAGQERIREQAALLDQVHDAILVAHLDDSIVYWNEGAVRMYGWAREEAVGRKAGQLLHPTPPLELEQAHRELQQRGEWMGELAQVTKDGRPIVVASHWTLLRDPEGQPRARVAINIDITERKKLEGRSLRVQRLESIGTLAGGIAHDLNNVLTPILMAVKLLRRDRPPAERERLLGAAQASVERGVAMIKQLLSFAGGGEGERARVEVLSVLGEVRSLLEHTLPRSITLQVAVPGGLWPVIGDATQLSQVLMNLCVNSRDAMPEGGTLLIEAANVRLDEHFVRGNPEASPGPYICLRVTDTGAGIPPELLDRIFDPFFTTKEVGKGTGLGLATVLGIVKSHGGFVNVYSEVGHGTRVAVYLPALEEGDSAESAAARARPLAGDLPQGRGELVLVVDDEAYILVTARATLEAFGYEAITATNGAEGVRVFARHRDRIRAVVLDMMMPEMDGLRTLRTLRQIQPTVRVIATSGLATSERIAEVLQNGVDAFIHKPYAEEQLLRTLADVLRKTK
jgi:two-component system cell cycle sensor histidine kinase/response regulator CckA